MNESSAKVTRSGVAMLAMEFDGICHGLSLAVQTQQPVGAATRDLLTKTIQGMRSFCEGPSFADIPPIDENTTVGDLLTIAYWCRSTMMAFLAPDELHAQLSQPEPFGLQRRSA